MTNRAKIAGLITDVDKASPAGFALGLHIEYTTPRFMFQTYPKKWLEIYSARGLLVHDPVVMWGFEHAGAIRWRDLLDEDDRGVMAEARRYGMTHGVTIAIHSGKFRSIGGFARSDRDYFDVEIDELKALVWRLHDETAGLTELSDADVIALKGMSKRLTRT